MTLHEAIEKLLNEKLTTMTTQEIADELNKNGWYKKKDSSEIQAFQIHGRTRNYVNIFERNGSTVSLIGQTNNINRTKIIKPTKKAIENTKLILSTDLENIEAELIAEKSFTSAKKIDNLIPNITGIYCIKILYSNNLPEPFNTILSDRKHNIVYIGIATECLKKRLNQELRAKGHGTFFRSLGAILGYRPLKGSLITKKNKRNYKFQPNEQKEIIEWINNNLVVNWVELNNNFETIETELIEKNKPLMNISKNPVALELLSNLRKECVEIANKN